jgi:hypothetical protein
MAFLGKVLACYVMFIEINVTQYTKLILQKTSTLNSLYYLI